MMWVAIPRRATRHVPSLQPLGLADRVQILLPVSRMPRPAVVDFAEAPFLVIWETTQACDLSCLHCRASAQPNRHPGELTTAEGELLLAETAGMGTPVFILSGGDPLKRLDLYGLIRRGKELGL